MQLPWAEIGLVLLLVVINAALRGQRDGPGLAARGPAEAPGAGGRPGPRWWPGWPATPTSSWPPSRSASPWPASWPRRPRPCRWPSRSGPLLGFLGGAAEPVAVVLVTLVLTYLTLVLGELAPKRIAMQSAERWALRAARPLAVISTLTRPVGLAAVQVHRPAWSAWPAADPRRQREEVTEEEVRDMVAAQRDFTPEQRKIIGGDVRDRRAARSARCSCPAATWSPSPADASVAEAIGCWPRRATRGRPCTAADLDDVLGPGPPPRPGRRRRPGRRPRPPGAVPARVGPGARRPAAAAGRAQQLAIVRQRARRHRRHRHRRGPASRSWSARSTTSPTATPTAPPPTRRLARPARLVPGPRPAGPRHRPCPKVTTRRWPGWSSIGWAASPASGEGVEVDHWRLEVIDVDRNAITQVRLVPLPHPAQDAPTDNRERN